MQESALALVLVLHAGFLAPARPSRGPALRTVGGGLQRLRLSGGGPLAEAAVRGNIYDVDACISAGAEDVDALDGAGVSALHAAVCAGRLGVAALLVARGADVNVEDNDERTPLHHAAANGLQGAVHVLLDLGASLLATDQRGWTPLHEAAAARQLSVLEALLIAGADAHAKDLLGRTPVQLLPAPGPTSLSHAPGSQWNSTASRSAHAPAQDAAASAAACAAVRARLEASMARRPASASAPPRRRQAHGRGAREHTATVHPDDLLVETLAEDEQAELANITAHARSMLGSGAGAAGVFVDSGREQARVTATGGEGGEGRDRCEEECGQEEEDEGTPLLSAGATQQEVRAPERLARNSSCVVCESARARASERAAVRARQSARASDTRETGGSERNHIQRFESLSSCEWCSAKGLRARSW